LFLDHGALTRTQLGELTGLSNPTANQIAARLEAAGLITEVGQLTGRRGPSAAAYAIRPERAIGVAVDIDVAVVRSRVVDAVGSAHGTALAPKAGPGKDRSAVGDVTAAIEAACALAGVDTAAARRVLVAVQGAVDPATDTVRFADTLAGWPRRGARQQLATALAVPVDIENDANMAAVAERSAGAGAGAADFAYLWLGEGLGLAFDIGGQIHSGRTGGAGELGYLPAPWDVARYQPGAVDMQGVAGGPAVLRLARAAGIKARGYRNVIAALADGVAAGAREQLLSALSERVALLVVPVLALLEPERVVLGGPTGAAGGGALAAMVAAQVRGATRWRPDVRATQVAVDPVLRGAGEQLRTRLRADLLAEVGGGSA